MASPLDGGGVGAIHQLERDHHSDQDIRGLSDKVTGKSLVTIAEDNMTAERQSTHVFSRRNRT